MTEAFCIYVGTMRRSPFTAVNRKSSSSGQTTLDPERKLQTKTVRTSDTDQV